MKRLTDILLQHYTKGDKLYSLLFTGPVYFKEVTSTSIVCTYMDREEEEEKEVTFDTCGRLFTGTGECMLFPSSTELTWERFREDLEKGTPVMVRYIGNTVWHLAWYYGKKTVISYPPQFTRMEIGTEAMDIVPVDKFNFSDATYPEYENYGAASNATICFCSENIRC